MTTPLKNMKNARIHFCVFCDTPMAAVAVGADGGGAAAAAAAALLEAATAMVNGAVPGSQHVPAMSSHRHEQCRSMQ